MRIWLSCEKLSCYCFQLLSSPVGPGFPLRCRPGLFLFCLPWLELTACTSEIQPKRKWLLTTPVGLAPAPLRWAPSTPWRVLRSLGGAFSTRLTLPGGGWLKVGGWLLTVPPPGGKNSTSVPEKKKKIPDRLTQTRIATGEGFKNRNTCLRIVTGNEISEMPQRGVVGGGSGPSLVSPLL